MGNHRSSDAELLETLAAEDETLRAGNRPSSVSSSSEWLVNVAADTVVPMITSELVEALRAGRLTNRSLVWRTGMHDWTPLSEVPQLRLAAGPSSPPPAASAPGPVSRRTLRPPEKPRRTTLPFGIPAVAQPKTESGALAVYDRPAASLTFADSMRPEPTRRAFAPAPLQRLPVAAAPPPTPPPTPLSPPRLTPLPAVPLPLPERVLRAVPLNTLAPTTAEAKAAAPSPAANPWGDLSVVLASELRAEKKATKRLVLWAALGSALVASLFTFWVLRGVASRTSAATGEQAVAPSALPAPPANNTPSPPLLSAPPAPLATAIAPTPAPALKRALPVAKPRAVARPKPKAVSAPASVEQRAEPTAPDSEQPSTAAAVPPPSSEAPSTTPSTPDAPAAASAPPAAGSPSVPPAAPAESSAPSVAPGPGL